MRLAKCGNTAGKWKITAVRMLLAGLIIGIMVFCGNTGSALAAGIPEGAPDDSGTRAVNGRWVRVVIPNTPADTAPPPEKKEAPSGHTPGPAPPGTGISADPPQQSRIREGADIPGRQSAKGPERTFVGRVLGARRDGIPARTEVPVILPVNGAAEPNMRERGPILGFITLKHPEQLAGFLRIAVPGIKGAARDADIRSSKTGDTAVMSLWAGLFIVSLAGLLAFAAFILCRSSSRCRACSFRCRWLPPGHRDAGTGGS